MEVLQKKIKKNKKNFFSFGVIGLVSIVLIFSSLSFAKAGPFGESKEDMARDAVLPVVKMKAEPSYFVKKGGEVSLFTTFEGYGGNTIEMSQILYSWCIDKRPVHSIIAGSEDEFIDNGTGGYTIKNPYGILTGGTGVCDISQYYNPDRITTAYGWTNGRRRKDGDPDKEAARIWINNNFSNNEQQIGNIGLSLFEERLKIVDRVAYDNLQNLRTNKAIKQEEKDKIVKAIHDKYGKDLVYWSQRAKFSIKNVIADEKFYLTRTPISDDDIDGDGLSDSWELKYFGKYAGKELEIKPPQIAHDSRDVLPVAIRELVGGTTTKKVKIDQINVSAKYKESGHENENMTDFKKRTYLKFLQSVSPDMDPDGDGFLFGENYGNCAADTFPGLSKDDGRYRMLNTEACWYSKEFAFGDALWVRIVNFALGNPLAFIEDKKLIPGPISEAWQTGVPYAKSSKGKKYALDNAELTNLEEYTFGTNPLEADTDADGVPDGYDIAGLSQSAVPLKIQKDDDYNIDIHVFGKTQKGQADYGLDSVRDNYNNSPYRFWRTDLEDQKLKVGGGLPTSVSMTYSPYPTNSRNIKLPNNEGPGPVKINAASAAGDS
ncbi:hypothetical protein KKC60_05795, partial [Patescibacteria group bacterium]|nr:hypothetical protein [Patescibacteria group bacterium]